ncbi:MAG TPA: hypothetical protein VGH89_05060, partial [Pseudonocardia sp.]
MTGDHQSSPAPIPADDLSRSLTVARPDQDLSLLHIQPIRHDPHRPGIPRSVHTLACAEHGSKEVSRPSSIVPSTNSQNDKLLDQFRAEALERNIPADDVERWMELVRPCALLTGGGDGPIVGRFGGPVMLPTDAEDPRFPLIVTI